MADTFVETVSGWQPIETAPYGAVLAWVPFSGGHGNWNILAKDDDGNWIDQDGAAIEPYAPSHWMPLPAPPR